MKFAKELEDDLVPEWRAKYLNYKQGKKKVKAISRALRNANRTPKTPGRSQLQSQEAEPDLPFTSYDFSKRERQKPATVNFANDGQPTEPSPRQDAAAQLQRQRRMSTTTFALSPPIQPPEGAKSVARDAEGERTPLNQILANRGRYGSFDGAKPADPISKPAHMPDLELPDPALTPSTSRTSQPPQTARPTDDAHPAAEVPGDAHHVDQGHARQRAIPLVRKVFRKNKSRQTDSKKAATPTRTDFQRLFTPRSLEQSPALSLTQLEAYKELDARQDDFFNFLDKELEKVDKFYRLKEQEAHHRLHELRAQLHELRDQRARDMASKTNGHDDSSNGILAPASTQAEQPHNGGFLHPFEKVAQLRSKIGKTSKAMEHLASPPGPMGNGTNDPRSDYVRKKSQVNNENVPHRFAKRRLKLALQEFYRGLELLKSYALLNRTGFRKINKKYDKAVNARPPLRYLNEKVNEAYFVKSSAIEEYLVAVEDLYARYFERGHRKVAVNKLRSKLREGDHAGSAFRNGLWVAAGAGLGIAGLVNGVGFLYNDNPTFKTQTSYLLQLYAGYFLALLLFLIFVLDCKVWTRARVNYVFVFEYDTRHVLDWRQLAELPCFFLFLNGLFVWLNFQFDEAHPMYLYWPILLFGISFIILALPFKVLYYHAREWWGFSNFRLLFAGFYPVEFRDFFLGDMYCSQTYAMSQIEVFFCLYANDWRNPAQCNSNHSMLLGFFTTLPAIWRFLQCLRRYYDSRNWFPHLANCAKYMGNILYYMTLSLYRLHVQSDQELTYRIVFIVFAAINALYCSFWDVFMDWSLGNFFSKNLFLRNRLAYRRKWIYYAAIVEDVILRHQWICYAIFTRDLQHSAAMSFFVGLAEVIRRGIWVLFRVENEHCNNVGKFRASRDIPLPYALPESPESVNQESPGTLKKRKTRHSMEAQTPATERPAFTTGTDLERQHTASSDYSLRSRRSSLMDTPALRALHRVGTVIAAAHAQDFTKRRRADVVGDSPADERMIMHHDGESSDDDEDDDGWDDNEIEPSMWEGDSARPSVDQRSQQEDEVPSMVDDDNAVDISEARRLTRQADSLEGGPS